MTDINFKGSLESSESLPVYAEIGDIYSIPPYNYVYLGDGKGWSTVIIPLTRLPFGFTFKGHVDSIGEIPLSPEEFDVWYNASKKEYYFYYSGNWHLHKEKEDGV